MPDGSLILFLQVVYDADPVMGVLVFRVGEDAVFKGFLSLVIELVVIIDPA